MKKLFAALLLFILSHPVFTQTAATVRGELLVQLKQNVSPAEVEKEMEEAAGILPQFKVKEVVSDYMKIWLFTFNEDEIEKKDMIRLASTLKGVSVAQANHIVVERVIPDDPFFGQQWFHKQDSDHDIDSDLAWEITTGGLTTTGDSIVVCVIEPGGTKWDIPDLIDNHWVNIHEIPGNGIDDDGNGYIDDYNGWNVTLQTDSVIGLLSHGAQVSSMIGSKGNNNVGITGVNWDVKIMQVRMGGISEANVISAYTYPLIMRKLYNETNGAQGAFVVVTNSSWGVNFGQPADAPLWCAMYDSLGTYGILSCGATANNNVNVDTQGDLPTGCSSDYLISVTSTNSVDQKVSSSGYGINSIDLGAPGNQVYLAGNTDYGNVNGTSFATPCVAGAVALLYSAPCNPLMSIVQSDPAFSALYVKSFILNGVDQNDSLLTKVASGGRLNIYNSLIDLMNTCGSCIAPFAMSATQQPGTLNYILNWGATSDVQNVSLRYKLTDTEEWEVIENISSPNFTLYNLLGCSQYEFQLMSNCIGQNSEWSESVVFFTDGCCVHPHNVLISSIGATSAYVIWGGVYAAIDYTVVIVSEDGEEHIYEGINDFALFLSTLSPCTQYTAFVHSNCIGDPLPPVGISFHTMECGPCTDLTYCSASGGGSNEYIKRVVLGDIDHQSEFATGYTLILNQTTTLVGGETYTISCYPGYTGPAYNQNFRVWIDYNGDGVFQNPEERVFDAPEPTKTEVTGEFTVPLDVYPGIVKMRVGMRYAQLSTQEPMSCGNWNFGEVEDYCVTLVPGAVSVKETNGGLSFFVFPNPANDKLFIQHQWSFNTQIILRIFDMKGILVKDELLENNEPVDIRTLPAGLYSVVISSSENAFTARFIKK